MTKLLRLHRHAALSIAATLLGTVLVQPASATEASSRARSHQPEGTAVTLVKPASVSSKNASVTIVVNEGDLVRPLWIDKTRVAEFPVTGATEQPAIRPAEPGEITDNTRLTNKRDGNSGEFSAKGSSNAGIVTAVGANVSPVFVDASGRARALPGGVIITLKGAPTEAEARAELEGAGLKPLRAIGARMWLVESEAGLPALDLASRLHASGQFEFAQPNWWTARTTK